MGTGKDKQSFKWGLGSTCKITSLSKWKIALAVNPKVAIIVHLQLSCIGSCLYLFMQTLERHLQSENAFLHPRLPTEALKLLTLLKLLYPHTSWIHLFERWSPCSHRWTQTVHQSLYWEFGWVSVTRKIALVENAKYQHFNLDFRKHFRFGKQVVPQTIYLFSWAGATPTKLCTHPDTCQSQVAHLGPVLFIPIQQRDIAQRQLAGCRERFLLSLLSCLCLQNQDLARRIQFFSHVRPWNSWGSSS